MDQQQHNTPSKLSTRYFPANKWQFLGSVHYVPKPRRRRKLSKFYFFLLAIGVGWLTYAASYFVLAWLLKGLR